MIVSVERSQTWISLQSLMSFECFLLLNSFFLDSYDLLASQVADLDFFTIVDIFGMFTAVELGLFDGDDFLSW